MPLGSPFVVRIENKFDSSLGGMMNTIRAWLDHHKMQPASFRASASDGDFEIAFNDADEASLFERDFAGFIRPA